MRSSRRAVLRFALGVALAVAVFVGVVPPIASYGSAAHQLGTISWPWIAALTAASLADIATTAPPGQGGLPPAARGPAGHEGAVPPGGRRRGGRPGGVPGHRAAVRGAASRVPEP